MTDATIPPPHEPQDGVSLPVVAWQYRYCTPVGIWGVWTPIDNRLGAQFYRKNPYYEVRSLSVTADADATIDALKAELASARDCARELSKQLFEAREERDALRVELAVMTERRDALHNTLHSERDRTDKHVTNLHAEIAALKAEVERLTDERDAAKSRFKTLLAQEHALSDSYVRIREMVGAMNPPAGTPEALFPYVEASVATALRAKQIDVEDVMRLADEYADAAQRGSIARVIATKCDALRAALLGDGGTLPADPYLQTR